MACQTATLDSVKEILASMRYDRGAGAAEDASARNTIATLEDIQDSVAELVEESDCDIPVESTCFTESTGADSSLKWADASQTLIFLDWDDTLFPTTTLLDTWKLPSDFETWDMVELSAEQGLLLEKWRSALFLYLKSACSVSGRCVIVTNAKRPWVTECIDKFAPNVKAVFNRYPSLKIVYANEILQLKKHSRAFRLMPGSSRGSPVNFVDARVLAEERQEFFTKAKLAAMRQEASDFYSQYSGQTWKNIVSIGDARYEHDAAWDLTFRRKAPTHERLRRKTVFTPVNPNISDLTYRLEVARLLHPMYVKFDGDFDIDMNSHKQLGAVADGLGMPELADLIRPFGSALETDDTSNDLDEIQWLVYDKVARLCSEPSTPR